MKRKISTIISTWKLLVIVTNVAMDEYNMMENWNIESEGKSTLSYTIELIVHVYE